MLIFQRPHTDLERREILLQKEELFHLVATHASLQNEKDYPSVKHNIINIEMRGANIK